MYHLTTDLKNEENRWSRVTIISKIRAIYVRPLKIGMGITMPTFNYPWWQATGTHEWQCQGRGLTLVSTDCMLFPQSLQSC